LETVLQQQFYMHWQELSDETKQLLERLKIQQLGKLSVDGKVICVVRLEDGFFGIHNTCPHAGAQLHHGHCNKKGVIGCPLHGYKFDIKTGRSTDGNNYKIAHYQFKVEDEKLFIGWKSY
jgi:nitrite reductase/ring-hydroxylating ferredoxin subunit